MEKTGEEEERNKQTKHDYSSSFSSSSIVPVFTKSISDTWKGTLAVLRFNRTLGILSPLISTFSTFLVFFLEFLRLATTLFCFSLDGFFCLLF